MVLAQMPPKEDLQWRQRLKPSICQVETINYNDSSRRFQHELWQHLDRSAYLTKIYKWIDAEGALSRMSNLPPNWDSYGAAPPNVTSINATKVLLADLGRDLIFPATIVPSAEGGVSIYFIAGPKTVYIESSNDGNQALVMYDKSGSVEVLEIGRDLPSSSIGERILAYLD